MNGADKSQLVFVHGIGGVRDARQECRAWVEALADGARRAGHADAVSGLTQGWLADIRFADYSDLFVSRGAQGPDAEDLGDEQVAFLDALVREAIDELGRQAEERGDRRTLLVLDDARIQLPGADGELQGALEPLRVLGNVLTTVLQIPGLRQAAQWAGSRSLLGQLSQVGRYLDRAGVDDSGQTLDARIRARVLEAVDPSRPLVVVAHSLGTVVAFEALHGYDGPVRLLVTLGSPLATGTAVLPRVRPKPPCTPESVQRWLNFWDRDDLVVARPRVHKWMSANASGVAPVTERVDSDGVWVHTATKYLRQSDVAGPVVEALRT
ncbi:esterase/lipase family protein [Streptacidiphilus sp. PAMC 29251]